MSLGRCWVKQWWIGRMEKGETVVGDGREGGNDKEEGGMASLGGGSNG